MTPDAIIASLKSPNSQYVIETRYAGVANTRVDVSAAGLQACDYTQMTTQAALATAKKLGYNSSLCPTTYLCNIQPGRVPETILFAENLQYECACGLGQCEYSYIGQEVSEDVCDSTLGMTVRKDYIIPVRIAGRCVFRENYKKYQGNFMKCVGFNSPPSAYGVK